MQNWTTYSSAGSLQIAILNATNTYRAQHNASALRWNNTLAAFAQSVAQTCLFEHSGGRYGENLAAGYPSVTSSIDAWGQERLEYDFDKPGFSKQTGHFTQLVWKDTSTMACSVKECNGRYVGEGSPAPGWFLVCEYWPRGNVEGQFAQQVQEQIQSTVTSSTQNLIGAGHIVMVLMAGAAMAALLLVNG